MKETLESIINLLDCLHSHIRSSSVRNTYFRDWRCVSTESGSFSIQSLFCSPVGGAGSVSREQYQCMLEFELKFNQF